MFVVIGSTTADVLVVSRESPASSGSDGFRANNLVFTDTATRLSLGGNGGNSAYVFAGLGVATALCSSVGQDVLGNTLVDWLQARDVDLAGLTRSETHATSTSVVLMTDAANQLVFHHLGATACIGPGDLPDSLIDEAEVLLVTSYPIVPNMRTGGFARALARAHQAGAVTALDIGPGIGDPVTLDEIIPLLPVTRYLIANTHELNRLTGTEDCEAAAAQLLNAGAQNVVIKRDEVGTSLRGSGGDVDVPAFEVNAIVSVGAGDAFNAGFLYGVQRELPPEQAVRFGNAVAALVISGEQGIMDAPTLVRVETFLAAHG